MHSHPLNLVSMIHFQYTRILRQTYEHPLPSTAAGFQYILYVLCQMVFHDISQELFLSNVLQRHVPVLHEYHYLQDYYIIRKRSLSFQYLDIHPNKEN